MGKIGLQLILLKSLLNLHKSISVVAMYLLLDDDLDLIEHILLTE